MFSSLNLRFPGNQMDFHGFDTSFVLVVDLELKGKLIKVPPNLTVFSLDAVTNLRVVLWAWRPKFSLSWRSSCYERVGTLHYSQAFQSGTEDLAVVLLGQPCCIPSLWNSACPV